MSLSVIIFEGTVSDFIHRHNVVVPIYLEDRDDHLHDLFLSSFLLNTDGYDSQFKDYIYKIEHPENYNGNENNSIYLPKIYEVKDYLYDPFFRRMIFMPIDVDITILENSLYYALNSLKNDSYLNYLPIGLIKFDYQDRSWNDILSYCFHNFNGKISEIVTYDPIYSEMKNIVNEIKDIRMNNILKKYFLGVNGDEVDYDILD